MKTNYRYLDVILGLFVAVLIISNVASSAKIVEFGPFVYDGGTLLFPLSYIFGDVMTEVYGFAAARRIIWIGFGCAALLSVTLFVVGALPGSAEWSGRVGQAAYDNVLGSTPRIVIGSLLAYWLGSFANSAVLATVKVYTKGRWLWVRTIGSTIVGEGIDTAVFVLVAFTGTLPSPDLWQLIWSNYVFKVGVEVVFTPLTYLAVAALKRAEGLDAYDAGVSLNPFADRRRRLP